MEQEILLQISSLTVRYPEQEKPVLRDIDLRIHAGEILCVIGESGCGKSTLFHAILQLPGRVEISGGEISFQGTNYRTMNHAQQRALHGHGIGAVFQEPGASLDPIRKIKTQFYEAMHTHDEAVTRGYAYRTAASILETMEFSDPDRILNSCPAQLSGGMNQRVAIAIAMAMEPGILLADEPTSALDVTVQAQIVEELIHMRDTYGTAIVLITHNMGVVAKMADSVAVMYGGRIIEFGPKSDVLQHPAHPYTRALLAAIPSLNGQPPKGIPGQRPDTFPEKGCAFAPRCGSASEVCVRHIQKIQLENNHWFLCQEGLHYG